MLEVENLQVAYGALTALHGVSLDIRPGEMVALVGPNGAGKTTLLKTISGLLAPRAGVIRWGDETISAASPQRIVEHGIALVPEGRRLFAAMTVRDNLELGAFTTRAQKEKHVQIDKIFALFPRLFERQRQLAGSLSGGEQQMLALGRALMALPRLLLLDEPSLGLAPILVQENFKLIRRINEQGITIFLVEQNVHQTLAISDYGYVLSKGRVVAEGKPEELGKTKEVHEAYFG